MSSRGRPIVLAGDLNVVPTDFDIYNPGWWRGDAVMQPEPREAYAKLLSQGWMDTARHLHPHERMYTYWTTEYAFGLNKGMRLDFLLLNDPLKYRLTNAGVDAQFRRGQKPSDHAPAWIELADYPGLRYWANELAANRNQSPKMLANDSTSAVKKSAFLLVVHPDQAVAELMAECPKCGAITTYGLELAWRLRTVTCSECSLSMRLGDRDLRGLRDQLVEARVRMDRLIDTGPMD